MRIFFARPEFADTALRVAARLRPSASVIRALVSLATAALAALLCGLGVQPIEVMAQALPTNTAAPEPAAQPDPAHRPPATPPARKTSSARAAHASSAPTMKRPADEESARDPASIERLVWDRAPLQLALGIGAERERSITFPAQMHIGVPQEVAPLLRVQTVGRTSYLTALAPFPRTRIVAEDRGTGAVILLDLTASKATTATNPVQVVVPTPGDLDSADSSDESAPPVDMVTLTRFAAHQMYAPRRLTRPHPAIRRIMVDTHPLDDLYTGGGVRSTPAGQWRGDAFYVTAVVLQNLQPQPLELSPLDLRGRWRAITFQHGRLLPHGSEADTTVVYLVCDRPFEACR